MWRKNGSWWQMLGSALLLLALLAAAWPGAAYSQEWVQDRVRENVLSRTIGRIGTETKGALEYATWSRITFLSYRDGNGEIYIAWGDGSGPVRLTNNIAPDGEPELTHGATSIVFPSKRTGVWEIHKMDADGSNQIALTSGSADDEMPSWSPDDSKIAFQSFPNTPENAEIYVMNADGAGLTRLTSNGVWDGDPAWSPDGGKILFVSNRSGSYQLWTMNPDGSNAQQLTTGLSMAAYPDWSPDGSRIAFNDDYNGDGWLDLAIVNADGTGLAHPLGASPGPYEYMAPSWAPNADHLAYSRIRWIDKSIWHWQEANVYGLDLSDDSTYVLAGSGKDLFPDWKSIDEQIPTSQVAALPAWSLATFTVQWSAVDHGPAGVRSYDVQVRDGPGGVWTDWLLDTTETEAVFTGQHRHTYYFRCRARDEAYNLEPYPDGDGDTHTQVDDVVPTTTASSPACINSLSFAVSWGGDDDGDSGIDTYDVQVRDGLGSVWTDWLLDTALTQDTFTGEHAHTYYFQVRARDSVGNVEPYPGGDGDSSTMVDVVTPTSSITSPPNADEPTFLVTWSGSDDYTGVDSYDVQVRDGPGGVWADWLLATRHTEADYAGALGHTYYFQVRVRDRANNLEDYPGGDGDSSTTTPLYQFDGFVFGIRDQPIARAVVQSESPVLTRTMAAMDGSFSLFYNISGTASITASHNGFGVLPPMKGVSMVENPANVTFYLPPVDDRVMDGGFESGALSAWHPYGEVPPALTATAHTGDYAAVLGRTVPDPIVNPTPPFDVSDVFDGAGGVLTSPVVIAVVPPGAVSEPVEFSLSGEPTVIGLPQGAQDVGLHFIWRGVVSGGPELSATLVPVTLVANYEDDDWWYALVEGEETLDLWAFDWDALNWVSLGGELDTERNVITVTTDRLDTTFVLLGALHDGPWYSTLDQELVLSPSLSAGVLSLVYHVATASPISDTLTLNLYGATDMVSYQLPVTAQGWRHRWWDLPAWAGPTMTVELVWSQAARVRPGGIIVDEVSVGPAAPGGYLIYLPLLMNRD